MKRFLRLLGKDLEASKLPILFNSGLSIVWIAFLRYRYEAGWSLGMVFILMTIPLTFLPIWLMWQTYQRCGLNGEKKQPIHYFCCNTGMELPCQNGLHF